MLISKIDVNGVCANATKLGTLTSGMVGAKVQFTFDSSWDGLSKTAVFRCMDITKDVLNIDSEVTIPHEVLVRPGSPLYVGVYGTNADGDLVIPTRWATVGIVYSGADPSGDPSTERSPEVWEQLQAQIDVLRERGVDDATIAAAVERWLTENPVEVDIPTTLPNPHKLTFAGAVTAEYDGSKPVEVKIPEGGSGGIEVTGAEVGQTIVVKAVDENGKPTEWETADLPGGGSAEAVLYTEQNLTEEQKAQVRENIGAMSADAVISLSTKQINALDALLKAASYDKDVSAEYAAFCDAFGLVNPDEPSEDVVESVKKGSVSFGNGKMNVQATFAVRATLVPIGRYLTKGKTYKFSLGSISNKYYYGVMILTAETAGMTFPYVADTQTLYDGVPERIIDTGWMAADYTYTPDRDNCIFTVNFKGNPEVALNDSNYAEIIENFVIEEI